jgi:hypothetical protein
MAIDHETDQSITMTMTIAPKGSEEPGDLRLRLWSHNDAFALLG